MAVTTRTPAGPAAPATCGDGPSHVDEGASHVYGPNFWLCYLANASLMIAVSLLFRYADFVAFCGGGERELGLIVGVGMIGALATRVLLGIGIDRLGPRRIWLVALCVFIVAAWRTWGSRRSMAPPSIWSGSC